MPAPADAPYYPLIRELYAQEMRVDEIARTVGVSRTTVYRAIGGKSPNRYAKKQLSLPIDLDIHAKLEEEAKNRKMIKAALARRLLNIIARDNLFKAILDD